MAGSRQYKRNTRGQFSSKGTVVTTGRAGGFANASHRANVANKRASAAHRKTLVRKGVKLAAAGAGTAAAGAIARRGVKKSPTGNTLGDVAGTIKKAVRKGVS